MRFCRLDIIKPFTILVIFSNVLSFMFMQTLLFWYVISKAIENIIIDKSYVVREIVRNSTQLRSKLNDYVQSEDYKFIYNQSLFDKQLRTEYNINLTWQWMFAPFLIVIVMLGLGIIYTIYIHRYTRYNTLKLDKTDLIILTMVFLSFLTEIIFIFVLIMRYVYISDMDVIIFFINSDLINSKILPIQNLPTLSPSITFPPFTTPPLPFTYPPLPYTFSPF